MKLNESRLKEVSEYLVNVLTFEDYLKEKGLLEKSVLISQGIAIPCPFHLDRDPSLKIDYQRGVYKCFSSCGSGGNILTFMTNYEKIVLGSSITYSKLVDRILRNDLSLQSRFGYSSVFEDGADFGSFKRNGLRKFKLDTKESKTFLELSNYIKKHGTHQDKIDAIQMMQDGMSADAIFGILYGNSSSEPLSGSNVFSFKGLKLDDIIEGE